ncbi:mechanosensitive ion channel domain-containing protein [Bacteroidota bacterium]
MKRLLIHLALGTVLINFSVIQGSPQEPAIQDTIAVSIQAISVTDIIIQATEVNTQLREKRTHLLTDDQREEITSRMDTLQLRIGFLREDSRIHNTDELNMRSLENLQSEWSFLDKQFEAAQESLNSILQVKEENKVEIQKLLETWELTSKTINKETAADLVFEQVKTTLADIRETESLFEADSKFIQEELVKITSGVIFTNKILESIEEATLKMARSLLSIDSPPLWKEFQSKKDTTIVFEQERSFVDDAVFGFKDFYRQFSQRIWLHLVLSFFIIIFIFIIYRNLRHTLPEEETAKIEAVKNITARPLASGWLISVILTFILYNNIPDAVFLLTSVLLFPPMIIILRAVITGPARKYIYFPLIAIILVELHRIGYSESLLSRLYLLVIILFAMLTLFLVFGRKSQREVILGGRIGKILVAASILAFGMLVIAFFSNIAGAISLSEFLLYSIIESATVSLFLYALVATLDSIITTTIYSNYLKKSSIFSQYKGLIYRRLNGLINLVAVILLINFISRIFNIWDPVYSWFKDILTKNISIGSMEFSLWDLFLLFFIIWLTIWVSRLIRTIFESESVLRDRMRRGAPGAMSLLLRITIITIGFMLAIAAAGIKTDKLTILLGAFGVGIGFGLQNIFNNLVSGIILAFERPIKEGDIIEVGTLLGIVKEIGIRSSIIRTYDGSEVITPNGNLISKELINWTRTDMRRRAEVKVGVAYGTDPQQVLDLLLKTTQSSDRVLDTPEPVALFVGFGDSSLDFRLLFWIADADLRFVIQSEMTVLVNNAIVAAGITIPFPQRDLHVKSVDPNLVDRIKAQDKISKNQKDLPPSK